MANQRKIRNILVDKKLQTRVAVGVVAGISVVGVVFNLIFSKVLGDDFYSALEGQQVKMLLLQLNSAYFLVIAIAAIIFLTIATHRIAGPTWVLSKGLRAMSRGKYDERLKLRKGDFLGEISETAQSLQSALQRDKKLITMAIDKLESGLHSEAQELLSRVSSQEGRRQRVSSDRH